MDVLETVAILAAGPHLVAKDLDAMTEANRRLRVALKNGVGADASQADSLFHDAFVHRCGNRHLIRILDDVRQKLRRAEIAYFGGAIMAVASADDHEQVIAALRRGEYEEAAAAIRANWDGSLARLRQSQYANGFQPREGHPEGAPQA